jgi:DNA (cytosine-5)-methyltransferase 1
MRRTVIWDHVTRPVREDDRRAFRLLRPGMLYTELPEELRRYRGDIFDDKYNRLSWDRFSRSITAHIAKDGYWYIHPSELRTLTVREAARIQTFPDRFRFAGTRSHAFAQIGNAVPPVLAEAVATRILTSSVDRCGSTERPRHRLLRIRQRLLSWASKDARRHSWRHPGDPWRVLVGAVLDPRPCGENAKAVSLFLENCPAPDSVTAVRVRRMATAVGGRTSRVLDRLLRASRVLAKKNGWGEHDWVRAATLGPAEEQFVRVVGLGEDSVLSTTAALRVAARLSGRPVDRKNRLSDGRMVVGAIIGTGENVAALNAGLNALGSGICTADRPECNVCPLTVDCAYAAANRRKRSPKSGSHSRRDTAQVRIGARHA